MERRRRITGDQFVGERRLHAVGDLETGIRERPHTTGKGCLYVKKLSDADLDVLEQLIRNAWQSAGDG